MDSLTKIALAKSATKYADGESLQPGTYQIDEIITVRLSGEIKKSPDQEYTPTTSIPLKTALALALQMSGVTRERSKAILIDAMASALTLGESGDAGIASWLDDVDAALEHVQSVTEALPKKTRAGAVKANIFLEDLSERENQKAA